MQIAVTEKNAFRRFKDALSRWPQEPQELQRYHLSKVVAGYAGKGAAAGAGAWPAHERLAASGVPLRGADGGGAFRG